MTFKVAATSENDGRDYQRRWAIPNYHFRCTECKRVFEDFSHYDDENGEVVGVSCECGNMAGRIWIQAPAARFDSAHDFPAELRHAAKIQLGKDFATRKEHDDYCKANGYEPIGVKEFESRAASNPQMQVPLTEDPHLERRIHERVDQNFSRLLAGELPPQQTPPPEILNEIKQTAEHIQKTMDKGV